MSITDSHCSGIYRYPVDMHIIGVLYYGFLEMKILVSGVKVNANRNTFTVLNRARIPTVSLTVVEL